MIWKLAKRYNAESRRLNGHTTHTLRRKQGEQIDERLKVLGGNKTGGE